MSVEEACGERIRTLLRHRAECSTHFGLSTVAGLRASDYREWSSNVTCDLCRYAVCHQAAVNGIIAFGS